MHKRIQIITLLLLIVLVSINHVSSMIVAQIKDSRKMATCTIEIKKANESMNVWADAMRKLITDCNQTKDTPAIIDEEERIIKSIKKFGADLNKRPIEQLVGDLVSIRRRSNRLALDIYLKTYDIRWPQSSIQVGVSVERVQKACLSNLDRAAMMLFNSPSSVLSQIQGG